MRESTPARHTHRRRVAAVAVGIAATSVLITSCASSPSSTDSASPSAPVQTAAAACTPARPATPGSTQAKLTVDGNSRDYTINIPPRYDGTQALPLVMAFHGRGSNASQQLLLTSFDTSSDKNNFILVLPNAIKGQWDLPIIPGRATTDTTFVSELSAALSQRLCVDKSRTYASGMSLGSAMTFALACAPKQSFAAFGGVGASFYRPVCNAAPPAPIIYFHGTADPVVPYEGGRVAGSPARSITARVTAANQNMADWANHNGCSPTPNVSDLGDITRPVLSGCMNNASVGFCRINGGGHTWPGANQLVADFTEKSLGKTTQAVDATELMWSFFEQYQLQS